ncbi:hypothetical protein MY04_0475 [Flammeovirga sp. MY04]|uniref:hypothetical protein n=1 Tax=Flammeovirga sp. MY04 TaxID=1191459 RepID=UPI0008061CD4|nr:hypothetical protein [Flammeovirga sp. MY04]ANQ47857.1 hypothetical protein MY04_0475 [Flammeovirga sp. MY04]
MIVLPHIIYLFIVGLIKQKQFIKRYIRPFLQKYDNNDGTLTTKDFKKITHYYGLAVTGVFGESIALLRHQKITYQERYTSTFQAAITGLIDDYFDEYGMTQERMKSFYIQPNDFKTQNDAEKLGIELYKESVKYNKDFDTLLTLMDDVNQAQTDSLQQEKGTLSWDQLIELTIYKGGSSFLYFRSAFQHQMTKEEEKALYLLGGITQFSNDIFDVYKDRENQVQTLLTSTNSIKKVREIYLQLISNFQTLLFDLPYNTSSKHKFFLMYSLGVFSRCLVCLDQYEKLEAKTGVEFRLNDYSRKELICDMEKWGNFWRSVRYSVGGWGFV